MKNLSESAKKEVAEAFKANPSAESFHVTTDGLCFENESEAVNHGHSITHRMVEDADGGLRQMNANEKQAVREVVEVKREDLNKKPAKEEVVDHVLTQDDFDKYPELNNMGLKIGDTVQVPVSGKAVDAIAKKTTTPKTTAKKAGKKTK